MKCRACTDECPKPDITDGVAYFACTNCGYVHEVKNYHAYTKEQIIGKIEAAFSGVVLGKGIGLFEAQALDDYESEEIQKKRRGEDEKINWNSISSEVLQNCHSSLSFFDADGMQFHLPAYLIGSIKGEIDDPIFHLMHMDDYTESRFVTFNESQKKVVIEYLTWCRTEEEYEFDDKDIIRALNGYWEKPPSS